MFYTVKIHKGRLFYLDQTLLPGKEVYRECSSLKDGFWAIKKLKVRGAPLIGVFAAYCVYIAIKGYQTSSIAAFRKKLRAICSSLNSARPTAVNLSWALERIEQLVLNDNGQSIVRLKQKILQEALRIHAQDKDLCKKIGESGYTVIKPGDTILTHCNAGALATAGEGTALAVMYEAQKRKVPFSVFVDETRPLLQGARLTAWELTKKKIDATLITDNMAAWLMRNGKIDLIIVGADRITSHGDVANKIGTYNLAVTARYHKIPFYVAAPFSTFDMNKKQGKEIPIETRGGEEVRSILQRITIAPQRIKVFNPAFDITPHHLVTAIISDQGIIYPPFAKNIKKCIVKKP